MDDAALEGGESLLEEVLDVGGGTWWMGSPSDPSAPSSTDSPSLHDVSSPGSSVARNSPVMKKKKKRGLEERATGHRECVRRSDESLKFAFEHLRGVVPCRNDLSRAKTVVAAVFYIGYLQERLSKTEGCFHDLIHALEGLYTELDIAFNDLDQVAWANSVLAGEGVGGAGGEGGNVVDLVNVAVEMGVDADVDADAEADIITQDEMPVTRIHDDWSQCKTSPDTPAPRSPSLPASPSSRKPPNRTGRLSAPAVPAVAPAAPAAPAQRDRGEGRRSRILHLEGGGLSNSQKGGRTPSGLRIEEKREKKANKDKTKTPDLLSTLFPNSITTPTPGEIGATHTPGGIRIPGNLELLVIALILISCVTILIVRRELEWSWVSIPAVAAAIACGVWVKWEDRAFTRPGAKRYRAATIHSVGTATRCIAFLAISWGVLALETMDTDQLGTLLSIVPVSLTILLAIIATLASVHARELSALPWLPSAPQPMTVFSSPPGMTTLNTLPV